MFLYIFWKTGSGFSIHVTVVELVVYKIGGRDDQYDPKNTGWTRYQNRSATTSPGGLGRCRQSRYRRVHRALSQDSPTSTCLAH
jgi:hypothetical protein